MKIIKMKKCHLVEGKNVILTAKSLNYSLVQVLISGK